MSKKAFDKIAEGLGEAIAISKGEMNPARLYVPDDIDVRNLRMRLAMSQDDFASAFGFTINQIREWEQGRARPIGGVRAYLFLIERDPESVLALLRQKDPREAA
ncbi:transcriptional regulator [Jiella endophytica]|uniref:Transcriptional regulator n=1 Tax=Jiella endophytica TaxID=2558362 RepID=A0A4Y8RED2_9HYPH|nr:helix-turn-helix domain-containing protein [Jiella endophytica]TFF20652.1 transcriptional regulator [Jiella endophytica]TFF26953.1 transcriptional regulator [Jiella endophytica]